MATEVHVRRLAKSWRYDFKLPGHPRERKGGYRTKAAAFSAGQKKMLELEQGVVPITLSEAFEAYMGATKMKDRSKDSHRHHWERIESVLGHFLIEDIDTSALDRLKQTLPLKYAPQTVNHHLGLVRAVLRFMWKRGRLKHIPYFPMDSIPKKHQDWYTEAERDQLLGEVFRSYPQWYLFFYLTCRLGLRRGEVYALSHRQIRHIPPSVIVDQQVQVAKGDRSSKLITRKNNEAFVLVVTQDVLDAVKWHVNQDYAGEEFLFSKNGEFSRWLDGHKKPLIKVQKKLGLRVLGHHAIGRHSVASQAATSGESIKAIQAQLGHRSEMSTHKYAHLGNRAQLRIVESLKPALPPHTHTG
ncbi:MAG: tyrosine-type recombinase/integrase [Proteobacteria bacterium]|nr:tyrosine-type recombinase/integrase [Pseudomonadota bacterium]